MLTKKLLILSIVALSLMISATFAQSGVRPVPPQPATSAAITSGTLARVELQNSLSSKLNEVGDEVSGILLDSIIINGTPVLKRGTIFKGHISQVNAAKRPQRTATMAISFDKVVTANGEQEISTIIKAIDDYEHETKLTPTSEGKVKAGRSGNRTLSNASRGAILGFPVGSVIYAGSGSALGGAAAPLAGVLGGAILSKGNDISLPPGTVFRLEFTKATNLRSNLPTDNQSPND